MAAGESLVLLLLFTAGVGYLVLLPYAPLVAQNVYVDEKALLPGAASSNLRDQDLGTIIALHKQMAKAVADPGPVANEWVRGTLASMGLETFQYCPAGNATNCPSTVTTGILRAPKSDGKECLVLVTEYTTGAGAGGVDTPTGLAIATVLMQRLTSAKWLAKDIILVAVENKGDRAAATAAFGEWVHQYHTPQDNIITANGFQTFRRAGTILAAVALDIPPNTRFNTLSVVPGGIYGLLPNLDVISVVTHLFGSNSVPLVVCETRTTLSSLRAADNTYPWLAKHKGIARCMMEAVTGIETGYHGHFLNYNVDAVTVRAVPEQLTPGSARRGNPHLPLQIAKSIEGIFRSFNNLIEKLHHSTFLYLLVSRTIYTTFEKFVYTFILLGSPMPLYGFYLVYSNQSPAAAALSLPSRGILHTVSLLALIYGLCVICFLVPSYLEQAIGWDEQAMQLWAGGCCALALIAIVLMIPALNRLFPFTETLEHQPSASWYDWRVFKAITLLMTTLCLSPVGVINFSLTVVTLFVIVPLIVLATPLTPPTARPEVGKCSQACAWTRYVVHQFVQISLLILFFPASLGVGISWLFDVSPSFLFWSFLDGLARPTNNLLFPVVVLVYAPLYIIAVMLVFFTNNNSKSKSLESSSGSRHLKTE